MISTHVDNEVRAYIALKIDSEVKVVEARNRAVLAFTRWLSTYADRAEHLKAYVLKGDYVDMSVAKAVKIIEDDPLLLPEFMFNEITHLRGVVENLNEQVKRIGVETARGNEKFISLCSRMTREMTALRAIVAPTKLEKHDKTSGFKQVKK